MTYSYPSVVENDYKVKDINMHTVGDKKIKLAEEEMPAIKNLLSEKIPNKPLKGAKIAGCLHMTVQTAVLIKALVDLGAEVRWCSSNRFSTQDYAAASIANADIPVFAWKGQTEDEFNWCMDRVLIGKNNWTPNMILDDGAELTNHIVKNYKHLIDKIRGISEETTSGYLELRKIEKLYKIPPVIVINNSVTKTKFDNIYGCRESLIDGIKNSIDFMISGKNVTVIGYGDVGKGCAKSLSALGAKVSIIEIDPISALQASMDGYHVISMEHACRNSNLFVTATGNKNVITINHINTMKNGTVLCNMGNFNNEIDIDGMNKLKKSKISENMTEIYIDENKVIKVLGMGAPVNLACANGHPSFVMSTSFANQLIAQIELWTNSKEYKPGLNPMPRILDEKVARLHLDHVGATLSHLTQEQAEYISVNINGPYKPDFYRY